MHELSDPDSEHSLSDLKLCQFATTTKTQNKRDMAIKNTEDIVFDIINQHSKRYSLKKRVKKSL